MKKLIYLTLAAGLFLTTSCGESKEEDKSEDKAPKEQPEQSTENVETPEEAPTSDPWTSDQLLAPAALAETIQKGDNVPVIFNIGPAGAIYGSVDIGATREEANVAKLRSELEGLDKDAEVVVYCGCCPFENCPNIRPAMSLLNEMGFTNHKLLNLAENLKVDWINPGYPMAE